VIYYVRRKTVGKETGRSRLGCITSRGGRFLRPTGGVGLGGIIIGGGGNQQVDLEGLLYRAGTLI